MENEKKLELLAELFEVDQSELTCTTALEDLSSWDSMTKLSLIVMMEDACCKKLSGDTIREFHTIGDIMDYMG